MRDGIFHSSGLASVAAGGGAGVITRPFQPVDQPSASKLHVFSSQLFFSPCFILGIIISVIM